MNVITRLHVLAIALLLSLPSGAGADQPAYGPPAPPGMVVDQPARPWELPRGQRPQKGRPAATGRKAPTSSRSVAGAPLPDRAHNMSRVEPQRDRWRFIPRALLFLPRVATEVVSGPVRGSIWTYDRYQLGARAKDIFFNDAGTMGLYPVASIESGYGLTAGVRFIHRDLFGERERLSARTSFGGLYNQQYSLSFATGDRFGPIRFTTEGEYEIDPRERFFGIGNGDKVAGVDMPVDPYVDPAAIDSRFRERVGKAYERARLPIVGPLSLRLTSGVLWKRFERSSPGDIPPGADLTEHYQVEALPTFEEGTAYSYNELELRYDSRGPSDELEPESVPSTGWLILAYGGMARSFSGATARYERYGGDAQRYFRLGEGPRVIVLRAVAEEVRGDEGEIPFVDLPRLGGPLLLRGYDRDRFRDRAMALTSAEYQFDLGAGFAAYLFADAGRVYPHLVDVRAEDIRVGYGGGLQMHGQKSFLGRFNLASSVDGGLFFNLSFDPVYDPRPRVERD